MFASKPPLAQTTARAGISLAARDDHVSAPVAGEFQVLGGAVVPNGHARRRGGAVVGIHEGLAAAEEEPVGAPQVQGPGQRRLPPHPVRAHPVRHRRGQPNR